MYAPANLMGLQHENIILHFSLALLPAGYKLSLMPSEGILSLVANNSNAQQHCLTERETYVLLALLECYPDYCPYEQVLAAFRYLRVSPVLVDECRQEILRAVEIGTLNTLLADVRTLMCRLRKPLGRFGLTIASITATGYMLKSTMPALSTLQPRPSNGGQVLQLTPGPTSQRSRPLHPKVEDRATSPFAG